MHYLFFFLCLFLRRRFLRLCVAILCLFLFLPQGIRLTNYVFRSDETYLINGTVSLRGTTILEPCVIKYTNATTGNPYIRLVFYGPLDGDPMTPVAHRFELGVI